MKNGRKQTAGRARLARRGRAAALGADLSSVDVTARWSDEGFWYPWSCTLTAAEYSAALSESVEANLGIPAERQSWEEGG